MHSSSRAPLLSATLSRVSCWIIRQAPEVRRSRSVDEPSAGLLHDLDHPPALVPRQRPDLHDPDQVADRALVALVVGFEAHAVMDDLLVERVALAVGDLDHDGLVHLVRHHAAQAYLARSTLLLRFLLSVSHRCLPLWPRRGVV